MRIRTGGGVLLLPGPTPVHEEQREAAETIDAIDWTIMSADAAGRLNLGDRKLDLAEVVLEGGDGWIEVAAETNGTWSLTRRYPGRLRLVVDRSGRLSAVNLVDVEAYVACVVPHEVWPNFHREALRAQAIASRTFVLYQMLGRCDEAYDVVATEAAQVYQGLQTGDTARQAVAAAAYTHGVVCTWRDGGEDRLFPTYYSAACGGMSQSAEVFGEPLDTLPLAGGVACDFCSIAPAGMYRWGPVVLPARDVAARLVARYPELAPLGAVVRVDVTARTRSGRPRTLRFSDRAGRRRDVTAEQFRLAMGPRTVRSTDFAIRVRGRAVHITSGRGFGHGIGLCQWGMQGQAVTGAQAGAILRYYYPGSKLTRVY
ncbi:MAG: SpoIID/LytB domain-containing protein [Phycisphaerae bacterium]